MQQLGQDTELYISKYPKWEEDKKEKKIREERGEKHFLEQKKER